MLVYATVLDLQGWAPSSLALPDDATQLLRSAGIVVARAVNEDPYAEGTATNPAKRDATCAQVVAWLTAGIRPGTGGLQSTPVVKAKGVGTARKEFDTSLDASVTAFEKRERVAEELAPEAEAILQAAGLLWVPVPLYSATAPGVVAPACEAPTYCYPRALNDWWRS